MTILLTTLFWCVLQITVFTLLAGVIYFLVRRWSLAAGVTTLVGSLVLVLTLTLFAASPWPQWQFETNGSSPVSDSAEIASSTERVAENALSSPQVSENMVPDTPSISPLVSAWQAFSEALANPQPVPAVREWTIDWSFWTLLWVVPAMCLFVSAARLAWGFLQVRRLLHRSQAIDDVLLQTRLTQLRNRLAMKTQVELRQSPDLPTPAIVGWWKPSILLPTNWGDWSEAEVEAVLAHELAHVAGRDYLSWIVARLTVAIHFYHPLVHWLAGRLQLEQELAADAAAVELVGDRKQYLHSLASLALATPAHRIAGPARTLFPSRSLLMRRVEMLRTVKIQSTRSKFARMIRFLSLGLLASLAIAVAGVRQAATGQETTEPAGVTVQFWAINPPDRIPLSVLPADTFFVASLRPALLINDDEKLARQVNRLSEVVFPEGIDLSVTDVAECMMVGYGDLNSQPRIVVRFMSPDACETAFEFIRKMPGVKKVGTPKWPTWRGNAEQFTQIDTTTLLIEHYAGSGRLRPVENPSTDWIKEWSDQWEAAKDRPVVATFDMRLLRLQLAGDREELLRELPMQLFTPIYDHVNWTVASADLSEEGLKFNALAECDSEENAQAVTNTTQAVLTLAGNFLKQQKVALIGAPMALPQKQQEQLAKLQGKTIELADEFLATAKPQAAGKRVSLSFESDLLTADLAVQVQALLPALQDARTAARRAQSQNNLKQLGLAMMMYHDTHGHFPPAVIKKEGQPPHSWRVAILPFLEQQTAYEQYQFDEPWDSEANKKVLTQMPAVFRSPHGETADSTNSSYFVLTGPDTVFSGNEGTKFSQIRDGTSLTLLLVEAKRPIPWTKPEDIPYAADKPVPELGGYYPGLFNAARCDGSVSSMTTDMEEKHLRALFTKAGREVVPRPGE